MTEGKIKTSKLSEKQEIIQAKETLDILKQELKKTITGQDTVVENLMICMLSRGHVLLEGMPGLAKTLLAKSLAMCVDLDFKRIQFTPDLLPADLIGTVVFNPKTTQFETRKGPIFTGILLADEINRSPAKVQSALLQCMEEHAVTIGESTYELKLPFMVLATENPVDQDGTYQLPEAQMDRFLMKVIVGYPNAQEELEILEQHGHLDRKSLQLSKVLDSSSILKMSANLDLVHTEDSLKSYIVNLVRNTRPGPEGLHQLEPYIRSGASPRASLSLWKAARAKAMLAGRDFVIPEDIKTSAKDVLRHRIVLSFEALAEEVSVETIVDSVLDSTELP